MEDLNDIFKEPEDEHSVIIGNWRWTPHGYSMGCVPVDTQKETHECTTEKKWTYEETLKAIDEAIELLKDEPTKEQLAWNEGYNCAINRVAHLISYCDKTINRWNELKEWLTQLQKFKGINQQGFSWGVAQEVLDKMQELEGKNGEVNIS